MKKIGFVDYYLNEWHANNYPNWIKEAAGEDFEVAYAFAELDVSPIDGISSREWCEKFGVALCDSIDELCEKSDVIVILAPSDPDRHLGLAEKVLPWAKPTYIDKTFAPDLATAKKIFAIAREHGTPFFSSSALRYASELSQFSDCRHIFTTGGGRSVEEYIIHQIEMVVKKFGTGATAIKAEKVGPNFAFHIRYPDEREAMMHYGQVAMPFTAYLIDGNGKDCYAGIASDFFKCLIKDMLRFFCEKTVSFDPAETLEVMRVREGALRAAATPDVWVTL